jgi:membrane protease YdiL (CAAX protease family)
LYALILLAFVGMLAAWVQAASDVREGRRLFPPATESHIVPWRWRSVFFVFLALLGVSVIVSTAYAPIRASFLAGTDERTTTASTRVVPGSHQPSSGEKHSSAKSGKEERPPFKEQMFQMAAINAILLAFVPLCLRWTSGAKLEDLGLSTSRIVEHVKLGIRAFFLATPVVLMINLLAQGLWRLVSKENRHPLEEMLKDGMSTSDIYLAYLSAVLLAPAFEELMFRGVIQGWLIRVFRNGPVVSPQPENAEPSIDEEMLRVASTTLEYDASGSNVSMKGTSSTSFKSRLPLLLSSTIFAAFHVPQMPAPIAIFFLSLVLGTLYELTGSLVPSFVLHALFNAFPTTLLVATLLNPPPEIGSRPVPVGVAAPARWQGPEISGDNRARVETFRLARPNAPGRFECESPIFLGSRETEESALVRVRRSREGRAPGRFR